MFLEFTEYATSGISVLQIPSSLADAMAKAMEDMTNGTQHKFKQKTSSPTPQSLFLFVSSIARTNLEVELVQRGGSLVTSTSSSGPTSGSSSDTGLPGSTSSDNTLTPLTPKRCCIGQALILPEFDQCHTFLNVSVS
jgi:hypothetical protein